MTYVAPTAARDRLPGRPATTLRPGNSRQRDALRRRLLALADTCAGLSFSVVLWVAGDLGQAALAAMLMPAWLLLAKFHGLYDRDHRVICASTTEELPRLVWWGITTTTLVGASVSVIYTSVDVTVAVVGWAVVISVAVVLRSLARVTWRRTLPKERVVIVGDGRLAQVTERKLAFFAEAHQSVVASIRPAELDERIVEVPFFDRIVVACQAIDDELIRRLVRFCRENDVKLSVIPPARALAGTAAQLSRIGDLPVVEYNTWDVSRSTLALKRALDIVLAAAALVLLAPVMAVCALAIFIDDGRPVLFVQARAGLGGMAFRMLKFRTMVVDAEARLPELVALDRLPAPVFKLRSDPRVTTVGRFLRRFSLDELPQLVNVLRGQMSLVGPRPEQLELADRYTPEQRLRLALRPGMTGPMQVSGRGELGLEERLMVERAYIENLSLRRDLQILASTLPAVLVGRGAF